MKHVWVNGGWAVMAKQALAGQVVEVIFGMATKLGREIAVESDPDGSCIAGWRVYEIEWERR